MKKFIKELALVLTVCATIGAGAVAITSSSACAPKTYHAAVVADNTVAQSLFTLQAAEQTAYNHKSYTQAKHKQYAAVILKALKSGNALNDAVDSWTPGQPAPQAVADAMKGLSSVLDDLTGVLPANNPLIAALKSTLALLVPKG